MQISDYQGGEPLPRETIDKEVDGRLVVEQHHGVYVATYGAAIEELLGRVQAVTVTLQAG
jgi:hypothetical protein